MIDARRPLKMKRVKRHVKKLLHMSDDELSQYMQQKYNCTYSRNNLIKVFNISQ